ncbi:MAG: NAD(P)H-binding protein [Anaerolineae bacterium]|nr:NAD(P)H-binding protein [Anaerolineae bacterium]
MTEQLPVRVLLPEYQTRRLPWKREDPAAPEIVVGHVLDEEALFQAATGAHTIVHLASAQWWGRQRDLERVDLSGTRNLIAVARSARAGRLIYLSQQGAAPSSAYMLHRIKGQAEELVRNSGLAYTILRPGVVFGPDDAFINHIAMMLRVNPFFFLMPGQGEVVLHPLYIDDLVKAIMRCLESLDAVDRTIEMGGQEYTTLDDLLRTVMRVTGMYRPIIAVPPYLLRWVTFVYSRLLPRTLMTPQWLDILATHRTASLSNMYDHFGFQPRRFEDTLLTYLPQQRHFFRLLRYTFRRRPGRI